MVGSDAIAGLEIRQLREISRQILRPQVQAEIAAGVGVGRRRRLPGFAVTSPNRNARAENAEPRKLVGAEGADVVEILRRLPAQAQGKCVGECIAVKRRRRQRPIVVAFDAVLAAQRAEVVAVFVQTLRQPGVGGEEERTLQDLLAPEWIADDYRDILPARDPGDVRDIHGPGLHLTLGNEIAVDADLHRRWKRNLRLECRRRILDEIRIHRVELAQTYACQRNGTGQVERRREEITEREAAQIGAVVVLQVGQQPRELARLPVTPLLVGRVVEQPATHAHAELGCELIAPLGEILVTAGIEAIVEKEAVVRGEDNARAVLGTEIQHGRRHCLGRDLQLQRDGPRVEPRANLLEVGNRNVALAAHRYRCGVADRQTPLVELRRGHEDLALHIAQDRKVAFVHRVDKHACNEHLVGRRLRDFARTRGRPRVRPYRCPVRRDRHLRRRAMGEQNEDNSSEESGASRPIGRQSSRHRACA